MGGDAAARRKEEGFARRRVTPNLSVVTKATGGFTWAHYSSERSVYFGHAEFGIRFFRSWRCSAVSAPPLPLAPLSLRLLTEARRLASSLIVRRRETSFSTI